MLVRVLFVLTTLLAVSISEFCDESKFPDYDVSTPQQKYHNLGGVEVKKISSYPVVNSNYKFELS